MRISTRLTLSVFVPVLMVLVVCAVLVFSYRAEKVARENGDAVRRVRTGITELNHLIFAYIAHQEERLNQQFLTEQESLAKLISTLRLRDREQMGLVEELGLGVHDMKELFLRLVSISDQSGAAAGDELFKEVEERLTGQLMTRSHRADLSASRLRSLVDDELRETHAGTRTLILLVLVLATAPLTVMLIRTRRSITTSLAKLGKGTQVVGSGNLEHIIHVERNDEIGDLTQAFNRMAARLKEVTTSKSDLEREVVERKRAEEALRLAYGRLQTFFDNRIGGIGIVIANARGDIIQANDYYLTMLGHTRDELAAGQVDWRRMTPPEWLPAAESALDQLRERGVCDTYEKEYVRRDGSRVPVLITDVMMPGDSGDILAFVLDITMRKRAEKTLQQRTLELQHLTETLEERVKERTAELADLSSRLVSAQENERKRISYDLHDNVWQTLLATRAEIERLFSGEDGMDREALQDKSKRVMASILETIVKIRSMQGDLWPYVLDDIGLLAMLDWYCREFEKTNPGMTVERQDGVAESEVPSSAKIVIYRILQETLSNVSKHSRATRVTLRLMKKDHRVEFAVEDNGIGFDPEETIARKGSWGGLGLLSIKARTELSGGSFSVETAKGKGTIIRATWKIDDL